MPPRYFRNPYPPYKPGDGVHIPESEILVLIERYVAQVIEETFDERDKDGCLYTGSAGIAYMFYKLSQSKVKESFPEALNQAGHYIKKATSCDTSNRHKELSVMFLCGNAGIWSVSAAISKATAKDYAQAVNNFSIGLGVCQKIAFNTYGNDEVLFGRAGYLSGMYWLNTEVRRDIFSKEQILQVCETMYQSGIAYSKKKKISIPLMYECYDSRYLGAAHGVAAIYHMFLEAFDLFDDPAKKEAIKQSLDMLVDTQLPDGNFAPTLDEVVGKSSNLLHWCHGAPGIVYVLVKAYLVFNEEKYLNAAKRCANLIWEKGLLRKGPGICHGVAGNAYVFLILYRLTYEPQYLYQAIQFADFLTTREFIETARTPDNSSSLYEGVAGTICFLLDLLDPNQAAFPFMDVFARKY